MTKNARKKAEAKKPPEIPQERLEFTVRENREIEQMHSEVSALMAQMGGLPVLVAMGAILQWIKNRMDDEMVGNVIREVIVTDMQANQLAGMFIEAEKAKTQKKVILPGGTPPGGGLILPGQ